MVRPLPVIGVAERPPRHHPIAMIRGANAMTSLAPVLDGQVLIAEDDRDMRALLQARFRNAGIDVDLVADGTQLRDRLFNGHPSLPHVPDQRREDAGRERPRSVAAASSARTPMSGSC